MRKQTSTIYRRTSNELDFTAEKLTLNVVEVLQDGGMNVTEKELQTFRLLSSLLLDRRNQSNVLAVPAQTASGKAF